MTIDWIARPFASTSLRGYLRAPWSFEETVARLIALSGQDPTSQTDAYKTSVEFVGRYRNAAFTLYDYKGDRDLHIGGTDALNVEALRDALISELANVEPTPYRATEHYDGHEEHGWPQED